MRRVAGSLEGRWLANGRIRWRPKTGRPEAIRKTGHQNSPRRGLRNGHFLKVMNPHSHAQRLSSITWAMSLGVLSLGCEVIRGSGHVVEEERAVPRFDRISIETEGYVLLHQANEERLVIEGEDNIVEHLRSEVRRGRLTLRTRRHVLLAPTEPIVYRIFVSDLHELEVSGSAAVFSQTLESSHLTLNVRGSEAAIFDDVRIRDIAVNIDGSGGVELSGRAQTFAVSIAGAGHVQGFGLETEWCDVDISGSGRAQVYVTDQLSVQIAGSGGVRYRGNPAVESHIRGSGHLRAE